MIGLALSVAVSQRAPATSGPPSWLPLAPDGSQPLVYADFVNGRYWASGAEAALADICYQNLDWAPFDPSQVVAGVGLTSANAGTGPAIVEAPLGTTFVDGMTVVAKYQCRDAVSSNAGVFIQDFPDYNNSAGAGIASNPGDTANYSATGIVTTALDGALADGVNATAANFTPSRVAASVNANVVGSSDIVTTVPYNSLAIQPFSLAVAPDSAVLTIAVYVLQAEANLPAMSAL